MPGTQAQNVRWVALDEQLPPARTGVALPLALALALALDLVAAPPLDELEPPLLQAASSAAAVTPVIPAAASRLILLLSGILSDNIMGGSFVGLLSLSAAVLWDGRAPYSRPAGQRLIAASTRVKD
jgi:hypothetical protein